MKSGGVDFYPDSLEHLFEFAGGGTYRFGERMWGMIRGDTDGTVNDIPIIRRFLTEAPEYQLRTDYWDAIEDVEETDDAALALEVPSDGSMGAIRDLVLTLERVRVYSEDKSVRDPEYVRKIRQRYGSIVQLDSATSDAKRRFKELSEQLEAATEEDARSRAETRIERHFKQYLRRYYKALGAVDD